MKDLGFTVSQTEHQSSRVCSPCSTQVRSTQAGFFFYKASFQESEYDDDSFRFLKKTGCPHHLMVPLLIDAIFCANYNSKCCG